MNASATEQQPSEVLERFLTEIGWEPEPLEAGSFAIDFGPANWPISTGFAAIVPDARQIVFYLNFGFFVTADQRDEMLQFITRANWGLTIGNFEFDLDDGHLRFKSSLDFTGHELNEPLLRNLILRAMHAVEHYAVPLKEIVS
ncbi:MAG: YbjN domain-containing protein [Desulfopila sp.]